MKLTRPHNYRLIIDPDVRHLHFFRRAEVEAAEAQKEACEEMVPQVRRHIDGVGHVSVEPEQILNYCSFCGTAWTENTDLHNGGCCYQDAEVFHCYDAAENRLNIGDRIKLLSGAVPYSDDPAIRAAVLSRTATGTVVGLLQGPNRNVRVAWDTGCGIADPLWDSHDLKKLPKKV